MKQIIKENKFIFITSSALIIITSMLTVISALMLARILDVIVSGNMHGLVKQTIILITFWIMIIIISYERDKIKAKAIVRMNSTLRSKILDKLIMMDYEKYSSKDTGSYVSWLTNDITQIETTAFNNLFDMIYQVSTIIFSLCGLVSIHYSILLVAIVLCLMMMVSPKIMNKVIQKNSKRMSDEQERFVNVTKETIMGYEVLYSYNLLNLFRSKILGYSNELEDSKYKFKKTNALLEGILTFTNVICQFSLIFLVGYLAINGFTTMGSVISSGNLAGSFFNSFSRLLNCRTIMKSSKPIFDKFNLDENRSISSLNDKNLKKELCFSKSIELKNLEFSYGDKKILDNVSLTFEKGKKYAIVGESGSGKTTLIKLILGHLKGYRGNIYIDNLDINEYNAESVKNNIAYIGQNVYIFKDSIKNNIDLHEDFSDELLNEAIEESCLSDFVSSLKYNVETLIGEGGNNISGGQKQRIALARALIRKNPIIIIDEGTSALDRKNAERVELNLLNNPNLTMIIITHHLNKELIDHFDNIYRLHSLIEDKDSYNIKENGVVNI